MGMDVQTLTRYLQRMDAEGWRITNWRAIDEGPNGSVWEIAFSRLPHERRVIADHTHGEVLGGR